MLRFIKKTDNYLIERFPLIWNSKLVWVMAAAIIIHTIYFLWGYFYFTNLYRLQVDYIRESFPLEGMPFAVSIVIAIVMVVLWLVNLFKNNAFKAYYPNSKWKVFASYLLYSIIFFFAISFPISFIKGYKIYLNGQYNKQELKADLFTLIKSNVFALSEPSNYFIAQRAYPSPFDTLYATNNIDERLPAITFEDNTTQFYSLKSKRYHQDSLSQYEYNESRPEYQLKEREAYRDRYLNDSVTVYYKDQFVDLSESYSPRYSLYNYAAGNFDDTSSLLKDMEYSQTLVAGSTISTSTRYSKYVNELLDRNNPQEIKATLEQTLDVLKKYQVKTNIDADIWFRLVYHPPAFFVDSFIYTNMADFNTYYGADLSLSPTALESIDGTNNNPRYVNYILNTPNAVNVINNIHNLSGWRFVFEVTLVYLCVAMSLALLLFIYRISNLKTFLFSIVAASIISILVGLFIFQMVQILNINKSYRHEELFILYTILIVYALIALIPIAFYKSVPKLVSGIAINITIAGFSCFVLIILLLIQAHQAIALEARHGADYYSHLDQTLLYNASPYIFCGIIIIITLVFLYLYSTVIKRWKGLPEG